MNGISMRLKSCEENRPCFVDAHVMFFVDAHPQIEIAGEAEVEKKEAVYGRNAIHKNLELAPELIKSYIDLVNFGDTNVEDVMHGNLLIG
jgi:hypothetical protein